MHADEEIALHSDFGNNKALKDPSKKGQARLLGRILGTPKFPLGIRKANQAILHQHYDARSINIR